VELGWPSRAWAAVTVRYFSTAGAGAADGTTWADRAALFSAGNWSTVISGHDFSASSLQCMIGPGTYTCSQSLTTTVITTDPTAANQLFLCGCDSSGAMLAVPDPNWVSAMPAWDATTLPVIDATTNIATINLAQSWAYMLKFTSSGRNGTVIGTGTMGMSWCQVVNSTANTAAIAVTSVKAYGCVFTCAGSSYDAVVNYAATTPFTNCRVEGVTGSSGNRRGITAAAISNNFELVTVVNNGGEGIICTSVSTSQNIRLRRSVVANNGSTGVKANSTAAQVENYEVHGCMITGNVTGIDGNSDAGRVVVTHTRLRDNTTNISSIGNFPVDQSVYTTDSDDATEYVSTGANGDFRIKTGATIWGMGFGVRDQAASGRRRVIGG
jgi:hypothetical protein